ncbi:MAG: hypothetical protein RID42_13515 [Alphaproteobacteria bacterium]
MPHGSQDHGEISENCFGAQDYENRCEANDRKTPGQKRGKRFGQEDPAAGSEAAREESVGEAKKDRR